MQVEQFVEDQVFSPALVAEELRTSEREIARTLGLGGEAFSCASCIRAPKSQQRLREMLEILHRVEGVIGSSLMAYAWFRDKPLPGFGDSTADSLVREGKADYVHAYLDHVRDGGYA